MKRELNFLTTPEQWAQYEGKIVAYECGLCFEDTTGIIGHDFDGEWVIRPCDKSLAEPEWAPIPLDEGVAVWTLEINEGEEK